MRKFPRLPPVSGRSVIMRYLILFLLPCSAFAACPQVTLTGSDTSSVNLSKTQAAHCSAGDIFTCSTGTLRTAGRVDSVTKGTAQISAFCHIENGNGENFNEPQEPKASFNERFSGEEEQ